MKTALTLMLAVLLSLTYGTGMVGAADVTPVHEVIRISLPVDEFSASQDLVNPVPDGQYLVIENITCQGHVSLFQYVKCQIIVYPDPADPCDAVQIATNFMTPVGEGGEGDPFFFSWVQPLKLYAPPGSLVRVSGTKGHGHTWDSYATMDISITGYYTEKLD